MVQKSQTGRDYKYIQPTLLILSMGDKQDDILIVNPK